MGKIEHLVVDANAFLKNLPLQDMGENIYTVPEVVSEIRDSATRQRLQVLPYELRFKEPFPEETQFVMKFAKGTGDYASLSAVDIKLMALAYQLTKEHLGLEAAARLLKTEPENVKTQTVMGSGETAGKKQDPNLEKENGKKSPLPESNQSILPTETKISADNFEKVSVEDGEGESLTSDASESDSDEDDTSDKEDGDDDKGWITPSNYKSKLRELEGAVEEDEEERIPVACLTTDFAMQNTMLHIGLKVMGTSGMVIKNLRTYILRCYSCFRTTSIMTKVFCPSCGNKTLKKVSVSYKPDGTLVIHLSRRVQLSGRGKKFSLPKPQGGKHAKNPILTEDQRIPHERPSKMALKKNNPLGVDYIANSSPFTVNDVYSRAAVLGINSKYSGTNYWDKKNPNESRRRTGKKKQ